MPSVIDVEIRSPNRLLGLVRRPIPLGRWNDFLRFHQNGLEPRAELVFNVNRNPPEISEKWKVTVPHMAVMLTKDNARVVVVVWMDGVIRSVLPDEILLRDLHMIAGFFKAKVSWQQREGDFDGTPSTRFPSR